MYINNVRLYGVKSFTLNLAPDATGLPEPAHQRLLLQGVNASGKTTILETIATLWQFFGDWIDHGFGRNVPKSHLKHYLADSKTRLAAIEVCGFLGGNQGLWIGMGKVAEWVDLKAEHPTAEFAGLIRGKDGWTIQLPPYGLEMFRRESLAGMVEHPNIVHFPPDGRVIPPTRRLIPRLIDLMPFHWLATYSPKIDLDSLLLTFKTHAPDRYDATLRIVNDALDNRGKRITGFGPEGLRVEGAGDAEDEYEHPIGGLSSGEKQMLLLIAFVAATLRPKGIVLIDEPDLHIHITMVQQLLGSIEAIVKERDGQLIVAAHSQEVWDWFSLSSERVELSPWQRART